MARNRIPRGTATNAPDWGWKFLGYTVGIVAVLSLAAHFLGRGI